MIVDHDHGAHKAEVLDVPTGSLALSHSLTVMLILICDVSLL